MTGLRPFVETGRFKYGMIDCVFADVVVVCRVVFVAVAIVDVAVVVVVLCCCCCCC